MPRVALQSLHSLVSVAAALLVAYRSIPQASAAAPTHPNLHPEATSRVDDAAPLPARDIRWQASAGATFDVGSLPRPAVGAALGLDLRRGALGARVVSSAFFPNAGESGATTGLFDLVASICAVGPLGGGFGVGMCGGAGFGLLYANPRVGSSVLAMRPELLATVRLELPLTKWLLVHVDGGALCDPLRPELRASDTSASTVPGLFALRTSLSLQLRFW